MAKEEVKDIDKVRDSYDHLSKQTMPKNIRKEELIAEINKLQEQVNKRTGAIRMMQDKRDEINDEIKMWDDKHKMLRDFDRSLKEEEKKQQEIIMKIRSSRKEAGMDAMVKQYMSDSLRGRIKNLIDNYGRIMAEPKEFVKSKMAAFRANESIDSINSVRNKLNKSKPSPTLKLKEKEDENKKTKK